MKLTGQIEKGRLQGDCKGFGKGEWMKKGRMHVATLGTFFWGGENACILPCARENVSISPLRSALGILQGECVHSPVVSLAMGPCVGHTTLGLLQNTTYEKQVKVSTEKGGKSTVPK